MSSPFNIKKTTDVGRNGFDLSQRHLFAAAPGMLLPIMHESTLPGDSFKLRLDSFTRMRPLNTAAFARFKEYYDFYWCSKDTLWPYYNAMVVNNNEPQPLPDNVQTSTPQEVPCFKDIDLFDLCSNNNNYFDDFNLPYNATSAILFDLLGCGNMNVLANRDDSAVTYQGTYLSALPWAMYQRVYADFYRNPQWERRDVASYNLRPFFGTTNRMSSARLSNFDHMFKMRYANWNKDYFMGLYPTQQFGDVSVVSGVSTGMHLGDSVSGNTTSRPLAYGAGVLGARASSTNGVTNVAIIDSEFSIVDLRRAQALQRWKEVTMTNGSSMYQQVKAHFGFELPEGRKDAPQYIGGFDNVVVINDIDASSAGTNSANESTMAGEVYGKAAAASDPNKTIDFTAKDFGYIMCIYHVEPFLEYDSTGIKKSNTCLSAADEYIPEFDKIGFGRVNLQELLVPSFQNQNHENSSLLGYSSRYLDYKTSYDRVHQGFTQIGSNPVNDKAWTIALDYNYLNRYLGNLSTGDSILDYRFFKVPPTIANNIMQVVLDYDATYYGITSLPFMISANISIFKSSNMSVDSLPY